jgi:AraC-like DNA-binding protein
MVEVLYLGSIFCALLSVFLLLFKENAYKSYANYLLSIYFIFTIACIGVYLLVFTGLINKVPYLYKVSGPLNYLTPILSYLYVRAVLYNEKRFTYKDLPHLIPFLILFVSYIPYYILPIAEKAIIVKSIVNDMSMADKYNFGFIPEKLFFIFIPIQTTYYVILQWRLLSQYQKSNKQIEVQNQLNIVIKWIKIFTASSSLFVIGYFILIILALNSPSFFYTPAGMIIPGLCLSISFFIISSYLLINPYVLSGLPFIKYKEIESNLLENELRVVPFIKTDYSKEIKLIDDYFLEKQSFLRQGLNISMVAVELNIPVRDLSYIINNYYTTRFNDFVNKYRVDYILKKVGMSHLDIYTLEALSKEAGFSHKSSFYRAFKKIHNVTPLEYLQN